MDRVKDIDLYLLLEISADADETVIKKAYRKKALKCHPDKNPDNPKAAQLFHELSDALSVLTDEKARQAYDQVLKAKKANELRNRALDAKRKRLKDDLEAREKASQNETFEALSAAQKLKVEIERLRKEGQKQLEEEQERISQLIREEAKNPAWKNVASSSSSARLKVRWKDKGDNVYDKDSLRKIFCKYGDVLEIVVLKSGKDKKKASGLVEMASKSAAKLAANIEKGFGENPLKVKLLSASEDNDSGDETKVDFSKTAASVAPKASSQSFGDYESLVMRQLRQEEERKRLIAEMMKQDQQEEN